MNRNKIKNIEVNDKVVKVRKHYQNYDHTRIPCEPKVYTIGWTSSGEVSFVENVKVPWKDKKGTIYVSAHGCSRSQLFEDFELYEDYLSGDFRQGIILDNSKWENLDLFLEHKRISDEEKSREYSDKVEKRLRDEKWNVGKTYKR